MMKVLGIHSSPFKTGNTAFLLDVALQEEAQRAGVTTEAVALADLAIGDCRHCNWCITKQTSEKLCSIEDDASPILRKIRECDVLVLASPVYFGRLSGSMACLIDRTRCFMFGKSGRLALKGKVGVALAVGWSRSFGGVFPLAGHSGEMIVVDSEEQRRTLVDIVALRFSTCLVNMLVVHFSAHESVGSISEQMYRLIILRRMPYNNRPWRQLYDKIAA